MRKYFTPKIVVPGVIVAILGLVIIWYLVSPLFINVAVSEVPPVGVAIGSTTTPVATAATAVIVPAAATAAMQQAMSEPPKAMADVMPAAPSGAPRLIATGNFYNVVHDGKGKATIYQLGAEAKYVLRLEDFQVLNGPDLHVWLVPVDPVPNSIGSEISGYVDLGKLKGNLGNQNYDLPANLDLKVFKSVVIWCQPFRVPFIAAPLARAAGS